MKTLYLDIFSGISGDMFLGAMIDLGVDFQTLEAEISKLDVDGYTLQSRRAEKSNIVGCKFDVHLAHVPAAPTSPEPSEPEHTHSHHDHGHSYSHSHDHGPGGHTHEGSRNFSDIKKLIEAAPYSDWVKSKSIAVFQRVANAEGKVHGMPPEQVHFHEVGAVDSIVDIIGACIALELLGKPRVLSAPVVEGHGWVDCARGRVPVPTAATLEILAARGIAISQCDEPHELVTPTGAALIAEFAERFERLSGLRAERVGYGLGTRDNHTRPNVLRAVLGETDVASESRRDWETDRVAVLETNLDDVSGEALGAFLEDSMNEGALDVFHTPIQMKKNRPGTLVTVLCEESQADRFTETILRETSAFGVRRSTLERRKLRRETLTVETEFGAIAVKIGRLNGKAIQIAPEYDSCRAAASATSASLKEIYQAARRAAETKTP
jgi:uncharacterized protein (TIGR00299 family) protein